MKYLAIDYGRSHLGLAISEGFIAEPYGVEVRISNLEAGIKEICQKENIEIIIIGISEGLMAEETKKFGASLANAIGIPVEYQDETLTSKEAIKKMIESGKKKIDRQTKEHNFAACLILQSYLDNLT